MKVGVATLSLTSRCVDSMLGHEYRCRAGSDEVSTQSSIIEVSEIVW